MHGLFKYFTFAVVRCVRTCLCLFPEADFSTFLSSFLRHMTYIRSVKERTKYQSHHHFLIAISSHLPNFLIHSCVAFPSLIWSTVTFMLQSCPLCLKLMPANRPLLHPSILPVPCAPSLTFLSLPPPLALLCLSPRSFVPPIEHKGRWEGEKVCKASAGDIFFLAD